MKYVAVCFLPAINYQYKQGVQSAGELSISNEINRESHCPRGRGILLFQGPTGIYQGIVCPITSRE